MAPLLPLLLRLLCRRCLKCVRMAVALPAVHAWLSMLVSVTPCLLHAPNWSAAACMHNAWSCWPLSPWPLGHGARRSTARMCTCPGSRALKVLTDATRSVRAGQRAIYTMLVLVDVHAARMYRVHGGSKQVAHTLHAQDCRPRSAWRVNATGLKGKRSRLHRTIVQGLAVGPLGLFCWPPILGMGQHHSNAAPSHQRRRMT